jgi:hypothetical protein
VSRRPDYRYHDTGLRIDRGTSFSALSVDAPDSTAPRRRNTHPLPAAIELIGRIDEICRQVSPIVWQ